MARGERGSFRAITTGMTAEQVRNAVRPRVHYMPRTRALSVEQTANIVGGVCWPLAQIVEVCEAGHAAGLVGFAFPAHDWDTDYAGPLNVRIPNNFDKQYVLLVEQSPSPRPQYFGGVENDLAAFSVLLCATAGPGRFFGFAADPDAHTDAGIDLAFAARQLLERTEFRRKPGATDGSFD